MYNLVCENTKPIANNFEVFLRNRVKHGYIIVVNFLCIYSQTWLYWHRFMLHFVYNVRYSAIPIFLTHTATYTARLEQHLFVTVGNSPLHDVTTECDCNVIYFQVWNLQVSVKLPLVRYLALLVFNQDAVNVPCKYSSLSLFPRLNFEFLFFEVGRQVDL